jgi:hypothetical protein
MLRSRVQFTILRWMVAVALVAAILGIRSAKRRMDEFRRLASFHGSMARLLDLPGGLAVNSKLVSRLAPWCVVIVVVGGCGSILYPIVQGTLEYKREAAPFRALGGYVTATGGGDMGITAGREGIGLIRLHENVGDQELARLAPRMQRFPNLYVLSLSGTNITDAGLAHLAGLSQLRLLVLNGTRVTQTASSNLKRALPKLEINVYGEQTEDQGNGHH